MICAEQNVRRSGGGPESISLILFEISHFFSIFSKDFSPLEV